MVMGLSSLYSRLKDFVDYTKRPFLGLMKDLSMQFSLQQCRFKFHLIVFTDCSRTNTSIHLQMGAAQDFIEECRVRLQEDTDHMEDEDEEVKPSIAELDVKVKKMGGTKEQDTTVKVLKNLLHVGCGMSITSSLINVKYS